MMKPLFRAARQNRIFEDVVEQIQEAIIEGRLTEGDRLPPERELREMLQTSRSTIREALRVLEHKGLIEIKLGTGGGAWVRSVSTETFTKSLDLLIQSRKVSLDHLAEFRERVEGDVASLAAERITPEHSDLMDRLLLQAHGCVQRGSAAAVDFLAVDRQFHLAMAEITGNPLYISILKTVHSNIQRYWDRFLVMTQERLEENYNDLVAIAKAVRQGDGERARLIARTHVSRFTRHMEGHREEVEQPEAT